MRIVFMGTPDFAVPTLTALIEGGHEVVAVVTQPDKPKGRGKAVLMTPVKEKAIEYEIPVYQPVKVRDPEFVELLKTMAPDAIVVVAFGHHIQLTGDLLFNILKFQTIYYNKFSGHSSPSSKLLSISHLSSTDMIFFSLFSFTSVTVTFGFSLSERSSHP